MKNYYKWKVRAENAWYRIKLFFNVKEQISARKQRFIHRELYRYSVRLRLARKGKLDLVLDVPLLTVMANRSMGNFDTDWSLNIVEDQ